MRVLSVFDGISCARLSLLKAGFNVSAYYACEIDPYPKAIAKRNFPDSIDVGDLKQVCSMAFAGKLPQIDLLIGGSPCQGFSKAGFNLGFDDPRSSLVINYVWLKNLLKPRYFLLENVKPNFVVKHQLDTMLGVSGFTANSNLVSAQNRERMFWTNIPRTPIRVNDVNLQDILQTDKRDIDGYKLNATPSRVKMWSDGKGTGNKGTCKNITNARKSSTLTTLQDRWNNAGLIAHGDFCRLLTHVECERLQTIPDNYTAGIPKRQRYAAIGNAWTVDLVAELLKGMQ